MSKPTRLTDTHLICLTAILFFAIPFAFMLHTGHAWEDWYITYRASKNLATGNGFVFVPGERLHTYTSPIGALIPALLNLVTGNSSDDLVLLLYGTLGCINLSLTGVLLFKVGRALNLRSMPLFFLLGMIAFDAKSIDFSINGMETSFLLLFVSYLIWIHVTQSQSRRFAVQLGLAWAAIMWTRPDGFIYVAAISGSHLLLPSTAAGAIDVDRKALLNKYLVGSLVATAIYLPWILWAWSYYGSPIPNTIVAKGVNSNGISLTDLLQTLCLFPIRAFNMPLVGYIFSPSYIMFGGWPSFIEGVSSLATFIACTLWLIPGFSRIGRAFSVSALLILGYLSAIPFPYPWYLPGSTLTCVFALTMFWQELSDFGPLLSQRYTASLDPKLYSSFCKIGPLLQVALAFCLLLASAKQLKTHQALIEYGIRRPMGLWLKDNSDPERDRVFIECLGYVGFYSNLKMLDFPGLSSTEVIEARRRVGDNFGKLIKDLSPEWVVLRPSEVAEILEEDLKGYQLVANFDNRKAVLAEPNLPGVGYLMHDARFFVFRRKDLPPLKP